MRRVLLPLGIMGLLVAIPLSPASAVTGQNGETFTASKSLKLKPGGQIITVTGEGFDTSVGIYIALCVINKNVLAHKAAPTPCGGGVDQGGTSGASLWISSNPPPYGVGLADPFKPGGRFSYKIRVAKKIGKFDCKKVKCAVTVRADHLRSEDRSYDLFLPITIK